MGVARNMIEDALEDTDREELVKTVAIGAGLILILYLLYRWTR